MTPGCDERPPPALGIGQEPGTADRLERRLKNGARLAAGLDGGEAAARSKRPACPSTPNGTRPPPSRHDQRPRPLRSRPSATGPRGGSPKAWRPALPHLAPATRRNGAGGQRPQYRYGGRSQRRAVPPIPTGNRLRREEPAQLRGRTAGSAPAAAPGTRSTPTAASARPTIHVRRSGRAAVGTRAGTRDRARHADRSLDGAPDAPDAATADRPSLEANANPRGPSAIGAPHRSGAGSRPWTRRPHL